MNFYRTLILSEFNHDPAFYLTSPSLSYSIMLDLSKRSFEVMTDKNMINILIKNIKAGICFGTEKYAESNSNSTKHGLIL